MRRRSNEQLHGVAGLMQTLEDLVFADAAPVGAWRPVDGVAEMKALGEELG